MEIRTPVEAKVISRLKVGDRLEISGVIYTGRDAVLPKLVKLAESGGLLPVDLQGSVIFHTAVSPAGIGPTTSNKEEIEGSIPVLSRVGVKIHLGKGALSPRTVEELRRHGSIFAVTPPVTALFASRIISRRVVAFPEEGMEALHELVVDKFPAIVAIAGGQSIF